MADVTAEKTSGEKLLADLETLISAGELATLPELEVLDARLGELAGDDTSLSRYQEMSAPLREKLLAEAKHQAELQTQVQSLVDRLTALIDADNMDELKAAKPEIEAAYQALGQLPAKLDRLYQNIHRKASIALARHFETLDLARWESYTLKLDICTAVEKLLDCPETELPQAAETLRKLRDKWKALGAVPKEKSDEINPRYLESTRALQHRIDDYYSARRQAQKDSAVAKAALCEAAEALADSTEFKATGEKFKAMQAQWKSLPPCGKPEGELYQRFRQAADKFFTARSAFYQALEQKYSAGVKAKSELITAAQNLQTHEFVRAKELRESFNNAPSAGRQDAELYRQFNAAMSAFFSRRREQFDRQDAECRQLLDQLKALPLGDPQATEALIAQLREPQFRHHSDQIQAAIRDFHRRRDAEREKLNQARQARQAELLPALLTAYRQLKAGQTELALPELADAPGKLQTFAALLAAAAQGDNAALAKADAQVAAATTEAEKIVTELEKLAGITDQPRDLAAELQAAIIGNSGFGAAPANHRRTQELIQRFEALTLLDDPQLRERFAAARRALPQA